MTHAPAATVGTSAVWWRPSHRIIPSRFPPIDGFERVAHPADLEAVYAVEALTNPRLREAVGARQALPTPDRITGLGAGLIMAPFTHRSAQGARFSTGAFGAYYAAPSRPTAIAESVYHRERFLRATAQPAMELTMRVLLATVRGELLDLRGAQATHAALYDPSDYAASQAFAITQCAQGAAGVVYDSVRDTTGACVALWRPRFVTSCRQGAHLGYLWDGTRITAVYEKSKWRAL